MRDGVSANAGAFTTLKPPLSTETLGLLHDMSFEQMTPVQAATIPQFLTNKDVAVEAVTGSGKTLAFVIPVIEIIKRRESPLQKHEVGALIMLPTRELATQVGEVVAKFATVVPDLTWLVAIGGTDATAEVKSFKQNGGHVVVGTPGRVQELMKRCSDMSLKGLEVLILDEADRLLDMGFETAINNILSQLPKQRRTGLFSATQTQEVEKLVRAGLRNPVRIAVKVEHRTGARGNATSVATPLTLSNYYLLCPYEDKLAQLVAFLAAHTEEKCIVYMATCASVEFHSLALESVAALKGINLLSLHGKMVPKRRTLTFDRFKTMTGGVLLCTDVAARGLDMPDVSWVVQYDPPQDPAAFVHRCGRTARLGREGSAVVFLAPLEESYVDFLAMRKVPVVQMECLENTLDVFHAVRAAATKDRALFEKANIAFVSFVRAYKEHRCNLIFRLKDLDMSQLAKAFALLSLPKMPELKNVKVEIEACEIDLASIPYKDKAREKQRQVSIAKAAEEEPKKRKKRVITEAWSKQKEQKEKRELRREKKDRKRDYEGRMRQLKEKEEAEADGQGQGEDEKEEDDDWKELQEEKRLKKKLKTGKSSKDDFDMEQDSGSDSE